MKLSGLTFAPIVAFGLSGLLANAVAAPIDGYARRSRLSDRAAKLSADVARPGELSSTPVPIATFSVSSPTGAVAALRSTVVLTPESNAPAPTMLSLAVARPSSSLIVSRDELRQPRLIAPVVRRPGRVAKYQSSLSPARGVMVASTPVPGRSGTASLNRFVFRREPAPAVLRPATTARLDGSAVADDL